MCEERMCVYAYLYSLTSSVWVCAVFVFCRISLFLCLCFTYMYTYAYMYIHLYTHIYTLCILCTCLDYSQAQQKAEMEAKERTGNGKSSLDDSREEVTLQGGHRRVRPTGLPMVVGERVTRNEDTHVGGRQVDSVDQGEEGVGKSSEDTMQATPSTPIATTPEEGHFSRLMVFVRLFRRPSNCFLFSQGIPGCMPWGVIGVFLNDYLIEDRSAPSKLGAFAVVATYGLGTVIGQLSGGYLGKRLYVWNPSYVCYLMGSCQILSIGPLLVCAYSSFLSACLPPLFVCAENTSAQRLN